MAQLQSSDGEFVGGPSYEPKIAEQNVGRSRGSIMVSFSLVIKGLSMDIKL